MDWIELTVGVPEDRQADISECLEGIGALAVTTADAGDQPVLEPAPGETPLWPEVRVTGLFPGDADPLRLEAQLSDHLPAGVTIDRRHFADQDWTRAWLEDFQPMQFGQRLWIVPSHCQPPDEAQVVVKLDPGLAFGTGTHPTTSLCLQFLDRLDLGGRTVLDFGCGSGVLAIAALQLGAARALCVDLDPQAIEATLANANLNGVADRIQVLDANQLEESCAHVVVANILAGPLVQLAPQLARATAPGGWIALSGLLAEQSDMVENAYREAFTEMNADELDGWLGITAQRID